MFKRVPLQIIAFLVFVTFFFLYFVQYYVKEYENSSSGQVYYESQVEAGQCCDESGSIAQMKFLMDETKTNKGGKHGYYRTYGRLFAHLQNNRIRILEIGVLRGRSMQLWSRFFPNYEHIYGIGYNNFQKQKKEEMKDERTTLYLGDQSNVKFLNWVCKDAKKPFDIIIDDGSHLPQHQIISLNTLFDCLKPGGYYVVEDIETSYWNNPKAKLYNNSLAGNGLYEQNTFIEKSKKFIDVVNRQYHQKLDMSFIGIDHQIASITYEQNLVVFRKMDEWDEGFHDRDYIKKCQRIVCDEK